MSSHTQQGAGILPGQARLPVDPTSPMCAPRDDNHNTPEPPALKRRRGYAFSQSGPASPGCPTYGVAVAVQGENMGGRGGAASVGGAHVSSPGRWGVLEAAGAQLPRRGLCTLAAPESRRLVPPFASGSAGQDVLTPTKTRPRRPSSPRSGDSDKKQQQYPALARPGGKFPARTRAASAEAGRTGGAGREADNLERTEGSRRAAGAGRAPGCGAGAGGALSKVQGRRTASSSAPTPAGGSRESGEQLSEAPGTPGS